MKNARSASVMMKMPDGHVSKGYNGGEIFGTVRWVEPNAHEKGYEEERGKLAAGRIFGTVGWSPEQERKWIPLKQPVSLAHQDPKGINPEAWYTHDESIVPDNFRPYEQGYDNSDAFTEFLNRAKSNDSESAARMLTTFFLYLNDPHIMPPIMRQFLRELLFLLSQGVDVRKLIGIKKGSGRKRRNTDEEIQIAVRVEDLILKGNSQIGACRKLIEEDPNLTAKYETQKGRKDEPAAGIRRIHNRYRNEIRAKRALPVSPGHGIMLGNIMVKMGPP